MIDLEACAKSLVASGKGLLAIDESIKSANEKRLRLNNVEETEEMRRQFRDLFLSTPGIEKYLSGVILHDETIHQKNNAGVHFAKDLYDRGIVPGIKVDEGTEPIDDGSKELITKGLIGLPERLHDYRHNFHTGFTKWRAVFGIEGDMLPTTHAIAENARRMAQFAKQTQEAGMVAIVEPEVLIDGSHSRLRSKVVIDEALRLTIAALEELAIDLGGVIVKTHMALSGHDTGKIDAPEEVAHDTIEVLMKNIPKSMLGVVFLSGGTSSDQATHNLAACVQEAKAKGAPWPLSFSFARALQDEALHAWQGKEENVPAAREAFLHRLELVHQALLGEAS